MKMIFYSIFQKKKEKLNLIEDSSVSRWQVQTAQTGLDSNTGYRVYKIKKYITEKQFFLTYGDGVGKIQIDKLLKFHKSHNKIATLTSV